MNPNTQSHGDMKRTSELKNVIGLATTSMDSQAVRNASRVESSNSQNPVRVMSRNNNNNNNNSRHTTDSDRRNTSHATNGDQRSRRSHSSQSNGTSQHSGSQRNNTSENPSRNISSSSNDVRSLDRRQSASSSHRSSTQSSQQTSQQQSQQTQQSQAATNDSRQQIKNMLKAGASRQQGILITVKGEFGFLKSVEQPDEIYFRTKDVLPNVHETTDPNIKEGDEMEFFVVKESSKGKLSDRAILLEKVPRGTVQLEITLATQVQGCVILQAHSIPKEEPGRIRLSVPIVPTGTLTSADLGSGRSEIVQVELWRRCCPENMILRVGDIITLDVQRYRPENLIFARNVKIIQPYAMFRECGRVRGVKSEAGFGFIRSIYRTQDLYFRLNDIIPTNTPTSTIDGTTTPNAIQVGDLLSFDVECDDVTPSSQSRYKAVRMQPLPPICTDMNSLTDVQLFRQLSQYKIIENMTGEILRVQERSERADLNKIYGAIQFEYRSPDKAVYPKDILQALDMFIQYEELKEFQVSTTTACHSSLLQKICTDLYSQLNIEVKNMNPNDASNECTQVRVYKMSAEEMQRRKSQLKEGRNLKEKANSTKSDMSTNESVTPPIVNTKAGFVYSEMRIDAFLEAHPNLTLTGLQVSFTLNYDRISNDFIATQIHVIANPIQSKETQTLQYGVLEHSRKLSSGLYVGVVRHIPYNDLYLTVAPDKSLVKQDKFVSFQRILWGGGVGMASAIVPGQIESVPKVKSTYPCLGLIISSTQVIYIDKAKLTSAPNWTPSHAHDRDLNDIYWNVDNVRQIISVHESTSGSSTGNTLLGQKEKKNKNAFDGTNKIDHYFDSIITAQMSEIQTLLKSTISSNTTKSGSKGGWNAIQSVEDQKKLLTVIKKNITKPTCIRTPIPIESSTTTTTTATTTATTTTSISTGMGGGDMSEGESTAEYTAGDVVIFQSTIDPLNIIMPSILSANTITKVTSVPTIKKVRGLLVKVDISPPVSASASTLAWSQFLQSSKKNYTSTTLCEIRIVDADTLLASTAVALATASQLPDTTMYYCDLSEIIVPTPEKDTSEIPSTTPATSTKDSIPKVGDVIEFYPIDITPTTTNNILQNNVQGLAVFPNLVPRSLIGSTIAGINFKPRTQLLSGLTSTATATAGVTAGHTTAMPRAPLGGTTMAQGPPDDGITIGFAEGWRIMPNIETLPWAHLLPHLTATTSCTNTNVIANTLSASSSSSVESAEV